MLTLLHLLPLAAGAAVSPALLGASVELLIAFGRRGARMLLAYLAGCALVAITAMVLTSLLPQRPASRDDAVVSDVVDLVIAAVLVGLAIVLIVRRRAPKHDSGGVSRILTSRWAGWGVFGLGLFMMVTNISTLVLVIAGAHEVADSTMDPPLRLAGFAVLLLGALLPILVPLVWTLARPATAQAEVQRVNAVISRHGTVIGVTVCLVTAAYLTARGFGAI